MKNKLFNKSLKNKMYLIMILIFAITIFTSCKSSTSVYKNQELYDYHKGNEGLVFELFSQTPPSQVYENDEFQITGYLENKGAHTIEGKNFAKITFIYDPLYFGDLKINNNQIYQHIAGRNINLPIGEKKDVFLGQAKSTKVYGTFETLSTDVFLKICYPYKTYFADEVCIDNDIDGRSLRDQPCKSKVLDYSDGQGAPVAITKITPKMVPYNNYVEPQFMITIENVGKGIVLEPSYQKEGNYDNVCNNLARKNVLKVNASLDGAQLDCIPENVTLKDNKAVLTCRSHDVTRSNVNFYSTLEVILDYNYEDSYSKNLKIIRKEDLAFANYEAEVRCQSWEISVDNNCVDLCTYCANNLNNDDRCRAKDNEEDKTTIKENFACVYGTYSECTNANRVANPKNINNNCIQRENLCWPGSYCGMPICAIQGNNYPPKIETIVSDNVNSIEWIISDINDQLTREYNTMFGGMNLYPDSERTCGVKINSNKIPVGYYSFINNGDSCDGKTFIEIETIYKDNIIFPPAFKVDIPNNTNGDKYNAVCLKAEDKLGDKVINKYLIESSGENVRLKYVTN